MAFSFMRIMLILFHFQVVKMFSDCTLASFNSQSIKISGHFIVYHLVWTRGEIGGRINTGTYIECLQNQERSGSSGSK